MDRVICDSGLTGWQARLHENYDGDYRTFRAYCRTHNIHGRLGYDTPREAWRANPCVQGSVRPEDFRKVDQLENTDGRGQLGGGGGLVHDLAPDRNDRHGLLDHVPVGRGD